MFQPNVSSMEMSLKSRYGKFLYFYVTSLVEKEFEMQTLVCISFQGTWLVGWLSWKRVRYCMKDHWRGNQKESRKVDLCVS